MKRPIERNAGEKFLCNKYVNETEKLEMNNCKQKR